MQIIRRGACKYARRFISWNIKDFFRCAESLFNISIQRGCNIHLVPPVCSTSINGCNAPSGELSRGTCFSYFDEDLGKKVVKRTRQTPRTKKLWDLGVKGVAQANEYPSSGPAATWNSILNIHFVRA